MLAMSAAAGSEPGSQSAKTAAVTLPARVDAITNTIAERELAKILASEEAVRAEVDAWVEAQRRNQPGKDSPSPELDRKVKVRFEQLRRDYASLIDRYPSNAPALLAYGNFLNDRGDEADAEAEWEKALAADPKSAEARHNLACRFVETGRIQKAFEFFEKALELNPAEPVFYYNFANALYLLRTQGTTHYKLSEQEIYAKVLNLYSNSMRLDPTNLAYATDLAQTYYAMRPFRAEDALRAWNNALARAQTPLEREEAFVHLARVKMLVGNLDEARAQLSIVTNPALSTLKSNLTRAIESRSRPALQPTSPDSDRKP